MDINVYTCVWVCVCVMGVPPVCSSSCPPAPCPCRRAAGPCTARTAACAPPKAPAGTPSPLSAPQASHTHTHTHITDIKFFLVQNACRKVLWRKCGSHRDCKSQDRVNMANKSPSKINKEEGTTIYMLQKMWICKGESYLLLHLIRGIMSGVK